MLPAFVKKKKKTKKNKTCIYLYMFFVVQYHSIYAIY